MAFCFGEAEEGVRRIYLLNLESGAVSPLTKKSLDARWPAVTPDGGSLFFCARSSEDPTAVFNLYRLQLSGSSITPR